MLETFYDAPLTQIASRNAQHIPVSITEVAAFTGTKKPHLDSHEMRHANESRAQWRLRASTPLPGASGFK
jgi:hypothetical protein